MPSMTGDFRTQFVKEAATPAQRPALVLNADYRPLSYYPLSLWSWQDAVKAAWLDRVQIVADGSILFLGRVTYCHDSSMLVP